jgi:hypothetical protein
MRWWTLPVVLVTITTTLGCKPLRQPLGSLAPLGGGGTSGAAGSTADAGPQVVTGTQIPAVTPEWNGCDPAAFRCFQDRTVSSSPAPSALFSGPADPDLAQKPQIVYPLAGSIHPINLADITFQWQRASAAAQTVFRIRLRRAANGETFEFFTPCNHTNVLRLAVDEECIYHLPAGAWLDLAQRARGDALTVDVAATGTTVGSPVATSDPITISFSPEYIAGGFYYWSTWAQGTMRALFGARARTPFVAPSPPNAAPNPSSGCEGCHTVSRGGGTIAYTDGDSPATGVLHVSTTASPDKALFPPAATHDSATIALNRDGTRALVSQGGGRLFLRDTATGAQLGEVPQSFLGTSLRGFHPEWSPDDKSIALTLSANHPTDWTVSSGAIAVLPFNDGAFGPVDVVVPMGTEFNFYPSWSPDGHWLAYAAAPAGAVEGSYSQPNASLRLVNRDTKIVYKLLKGSGAPGHTSTWPKFAPFAQAGGLMFLSFNAKLDYGYFLLDNVKRGTPQLWLTAIDVRKLQAAGDDPSSPPVWLPFQDVVERNYLGVWSERVGCRVEAGKSIGCGANETCANGACAMLGSAAP